MWGVDPFFEEQRWCTSWRFPRRISNMPRRDPVQVYDWEDVRRRITPLVMNVVENIADTD